MLKELAESFSWERSQTQMPQQRSFFTPPPRKKNKLDHAGEFASALSQIWGAQVKDLRRTQLRPTQQKKRSLKERKELRFLQESVSSDQTAIFVDDVITSGATAQAAFEALGRPRDYEVWTVACRPKLAGLQGL